MNGIILSLRVVPRLEGIPFDRDIVQRSLLFPLLRLRALLGSGTC